MGKLALCFKRLLITEKDNGNLENSVEACFQHILDKSAAIESAKRYALMAASVYGDWIHHDEMSGTMFFKRARKTIGTKLKKCAPKKKARMRNVGKRAPKCSSL